MRRIWWLLAVLGLGVSLVAACAPRSSGRGGRGGSDDDDSAVSNDDDAANDDDATGDDDDSVDVETGTWDMTMGELLVDSCFGGAGTTGGSLGTTQIAWVGDGDIDFTMRDEDDQFFQCAFTTGASYACVADPLDVELPDGWNAAVTRNGTRDGVFESSSFSTFVQDNIDTCSGADCASLAQVAEIEFPCVAQFTGSAVY